MLMTATRFIGNILAANGGLYAAIHTPLTNGWGYVITIFGALICVYCGRTVIEMIDGGEVVFRSPKANSETTEAIENWRKGQ